jgi:hypothetical protein
MFIPLCDLVKLAAPQATSVITIGLDDVTACHIYPCLGAKINKTPENQRLTEVFCLMLMVPGTGLNSRMNKGFA